MLEKLRRWVAGLCFCLMVTGAWAQTQVSSSDTADALLGLANQASVIFAGRVVSVTRSAGSGFVEVRFGIDEGILGCAGATEYVLREWAGLWTGRAPRYRVGARLLMLLYGRGPSGMSAPVGGMDGVIPLVGTGSSPVPDANGTMSADAGGSGTDVSSSFAVDMRWVQTSAARTSGGTLAAAPVVAQASGPVQGSKASAVVGALTLSGTGSSPRNVSGGPVRATGSEAGLSGATAALPTLDSVLGFLRAANAQR